MKVIGGYGSAGSGSRSARRTASAVGVGMTYANQESRLARRVLDAALTDPTPTDALEAISENVCPWCPDTRTFRQLSHHLSRGHGFRMADVREYLGIPKHAALASQEYREACRERAIARGAVEQMRGAPHPARHSLSAYGMASQRAKVERGWAAQRAAGKRDIDRVCEVCGQVWHGPHYRRTCGSESCLFALKSSITKGRPRTESQRVAARAVMARLHRRRAEATGSTVPAA
jgi:hypothetical protein